MQSGVGKLSCNKTALKRCTSTETLWNRKAPSLSSPENEEIFLPKLPKSWHADVFKGPKVLTTIAAKRYWLPMLAYFSSLREAASSAATPASWADPVTYDSAKGQVTLLLLLLYAVGCWKDYVFDLSICLYVWLTYVSGQRHFLTGLPSTYSFVLLSAFAWICCRPMCS